MDVFHLRASSSAFKYGREVWSCGNIRVVRRTSVERRLRHPFFFFSLPLFVRFYALIFAVFCCMNKSFRVQILFKWKKTNNSAKNSLFSFFCSLFAAVVIPSSWIVVLLQRDECDKLPIYLLKYFCNAFAVELDVWLTRTTRLHHVLSTYSFSGVAAPAPIPLQLYFLRSSTDSARKRQKWGNKM